MLWFSNTIITILLTLLPDYCLCDRHEPKHITHIISVNLQQAWNYYWEVETEDTETQWIKWPKSRWGSSRIGVDHPKAQPLYHLHCSAALPQTTVFLVFCTLQIHSPSVSSGIFLLSGKPSKSPTLIAQTVLNIPRVLLWHPGLPHSVALTTFSHDKITITWGALKSPDAQAISQNNKIRISKHHYFFKAPQIIPLCSQGRKPQCASI